MECEKKTIRFQGSSLAGRHTRALNHCKTHAEVADFHHLGVRNHPRGQRRQPCVSMKAERLAVQAGLTVEPVGGVPW